MKPARRYCRYSKVVCVGVRDRSGGWKRWRVKPGINQGYGGEEKPALVFAQTKPNQIVELNRNQSRQRFGEPGSCRS